MKIGLLLYYLILLKSHVFLVTVMNRWLQHTIESGDEPVEIVASRTLFIPEFIAEMAKIKNDGAPSRDKFHATSKKRSCFCIVV